jgi:hypothetical protein
MTGWLRLQIDASFTRLQINGNDNVCKSASEQ